MSLSQRELHASRHAACSLPPCHEPPTLNWQAAAAGWQVCSPVAVTMPAYACRQGRSQFYSHLVRTPERPHKGSCLLGWMHCWQHAFLPAIDPCSQHTCKLDALPPVPPASAGLPLLLLLLELELPAPPPPEVLSLLLWLEVLNQRAAGCCVLSCCRASWRRVWPPNGVEQRGCRHVP